VAIWVTQHVLSDLRRYRFRYDGKTVYLHGRQQRIGD
jgi:hypothetical protein